MSLWGKLKRAVLQYFNDADASSIFIATALYALIAWLLLYWAGETPLTDPVDFLYYLAVTSSTVGYGDYSPVTPTGKLVVSLFIIPVGLSIFALVIGRIAAFASAQWQKNIKGLKNIMEKNHILVIGWNGERTMQLLQLLLAEREQSIEKNEIVLCVRADITNPMPGEIGFVRVASFNRDIDMNKANVRHAKTILIDNPEDDMTMTTSLYCSKHNPTAHIVAYFNDESLVELLQQHCPNVECTPSVAVEMLAKSAFDPGSSLLHHDLLSVEAGQEQYSTVVPEACHGMSVETVFFGLKKIHNAIFIGYAKAADKQHIIVNPDFSDNISAGDRLFYIACSRINELNWEAL
ncbi:MAG: potassium channel family protein [Glaciecola sp.]|jgi:voltage-gated potassium channel